MKKIMLVWVLLLLLPGCAQHADAVEPMLQLRAELLQKGCAFAAEVTADYGDKTYGFTMSCSADEKGNVTFRVLEPETIAGITGKIEQGKGSLTFDGTALAFELLADGQLSPVAAPWVLVRTLRGGQILSGGKAGEYYQVSLQDSYQADALQLELWLSADNRPAQAEILFRGRRILTMQVKDFVIG